MARCFVNYTDREMDWGDSMLIASGIPPLRGPSRFLLYSLMLLHVTGELRWLMLTPGALWHADEASGALDVEEGELRRIDLSQSKSCHLSEDGLELVIAGEGKCHLLSSTSRSSVDLAQWHRAIQDELGKSQLDA